MIEDIIVDLLYIEETTIEPRNDNEVNEILSLMDQKYFEEANNQS